MTRERGDMAEQLDYGPLHGVLQRMDSRLAQLQRDRDRRAVFLTVYRAMTEQMLEALPQGRFLDPPWTLWLTVRFAQMYFEADDAFCDDPATCPLPWERAFTVAGMPFVLAVEHALLGINAHITYDLPRAVAETMRQFGDHEPGGVLPGEAILARRRYDYEVVNEILAETTDGVQRVLAKRFSPLIHVVDSVALRLDEYVAEAFLRYARTQGWNHAVALAFTSDEDERELIREHLADVAVGLARRIDLASHFPFPLRRGIALVRKPIVPQLT